MEDTVLLIVMRGGVEMFIHTKKKAMGSYEKIIYEGYVVVTLRVQ
jgi:hypothetical protein